MTNNLATSQGWSFVEPIVQDGSAREYTRYAKGGQTALLMQVDADEPGGAYDGFLKIGQWLRDIGVNAPEIYAQDAARGELLIQDFGGVSFKAAIDSGHDVGELYALAGEVLGHMQTQHCPLALPSYYDEFIHEARDLIIRWYVPALRGEAFDPALHQAYLEAWDAVEAQISAPPPMGVLHLDYHLENMLWLPKDSGIARCGLIDFQDAMIGPTPYDLVNLCEDMRADVPAEIQAQLLAGCDEDFMRWYRVLGTQFHCRLIGQCVRWAVRDGKPGYMQFMPRLFGYVRDALDDPLLVPLKAFFDEVGLSFEQFPELDLEAASALLLKSNQE